MTDDAVTDDPVGSDDARGPRKISRRVLIRDAGLAGGVGLGLGLGLAQLGGDRQRRSTESSNAVGFFGSHQAGIETPPPTRLAVTAFDITTSDREAVSVLMQEWTLAASRLTAGVPADGDDSRETEGLGPSALTLTFGFGLTVFDDRFGLSSQAPRGLTDLPAFPGDELDETMSGGDIVVQACAEDHQVAYHAVRQLARIGAGAVKPRWQQVGFRGDTGGVTTPRNLLGFKDGTVNPTPGTPAFASTVWASDGWIRGGTYLCVRRIRIDLENWDAHTATDQQIVIGREKDSGAPLSGGSERSPLNLGALGDGGTPAIPVDSHVRLAAPQTNNGASILRRGYNYDDGIDPATGAADAGTIFLAFVADIDAQFVPIQARLATSDRLNSFTTAVGSATFAILPGIAEGDYLGRALLG